MRSHSSSTRNQLIPFMNSIWTTVIRRAVACEPVVRLRCILASLVFALTAQAQWQDVGYSLPGGWSAIYLHGDASYDAIQNLLPRG